jgi:spore maturation protein CgeB
MACNTLVMATMPKDGKDLHFVPGKNFVEVNRSNFVEKIRYYLKHDDERHQIALRGMQTVKKYHTVQKRANQLMTYLESICK